MGAPEILIFIIILTIIFYKWYKNYLGHHKLKWMPNVPGWPIIGNALEFGDSKEIINKLEWLVGKYGKLIKLDLLTEPNIVATDYDFVEYVLGTHHILDKSSFYWHATNWLGTGLLTSKGPKWRKRRKMLTPAFHFSILEQYIECFEPNGNILVELLEKEIGKDSVDVYPYITLYSLDVICEAAMGVSINAQKNKDSDYVKNVKEICRIIFDRVFSFYKRNDVSYMLSKDYYTEKRILEQMHGATNSVIDARKEKLENKGAFANGVEKDDLGRKKKLAFLDILLQSSIDGKPLLRKDIREEVNTFMFEGHDTSASAISFALFLMANHPEVQEQVLQEQIDIFGDDITRSPSYNDLQEMKYLEMVIKETLRLYPSVPTFGRTTNKDTEYKGNIIPKGTNITIFAYGVLRDPDNFHDPDKFDPSRFKYQDGTRPFNFIPFSAGPRNCIGQKFAMLEMKSTLSNILRNFELLPSIPAHNLILIPEAILKSRNGVRIRLARRKW